MHWIALAPPEGSASSPDAAWATPTGQALLWRALALTPQVARLDEALVLQVAGCLRLWGGMAALLARLLLPLPGGAADGATPQAVPVHALGATALAALARLRLGLPAAQQPPAQWPLAVLSAARPHLALLHGLGLRTCGAVHALPRHELAQRTSPALLAALDAVLTPERSPTPPLAWITLPEHFEMGCELDHEVRHANALLGAAAGLLAALEAWLLARQLGLHAAELEWTHAQRRLDGAPLPATGALRLHTSTPVATAARLAPLLAEHLARTRLAAPVRALRLRALETAPLPAASGALWPEHAGPAAGHALSAFIDRVQARLGAGSVSQPQVQADHRIEAMQRWEAPTPAHASAAAPRQAARRGGRATRPSATRSVSTNANVNTNANRPADAVGAAGQAGQTGGVSKTGESRQATEAMQTNTAAPTVSRPPLQTAALPDAPAAAALLPTWVWPEPQPLALHDGQPQLAPPHGRGPVRLLACIQRSEPPWWQGAAGAALPREHWLAEHPQAGLMWLARESVPSAARPSAAAPAEAASHWLWLGRYG